VAFQAERRYRRAIEHLGIVGAVGLVATLASAQIDCRMFEDERTLFLAMALEADFLARERLADLLGIDAAVRLMAIGALHGVFLHPVMEWFGKLGSLKSVAAHAKIAGTILERTRQRSGLMNAVAVSAE
jgi:glycine/D-amino acid oxidase-like deaminating enzyme